MTRKLNSIVFATFAVRSHGQRTATNGMIEPMTYFFTKRSKRFTLIEQPHPGGDSVIPYLEAYKGARRVGCSRFFLSSFLLYPLLKLVHDQSTSPIFKIRDFLSVVEFVFFGNRRYDLFIGLEAVNAIAGILLRKLGLVKTVVYYVSDYSPDRYKPKWVNDLYLFLDRFAAKHSDFVWDVSLAMMPARIKVGLDPQKAAPLIHVPNALFPKQISYLPYSRVVPNSLVFVGTLGWINGPDLAIKALKIVLKSVPGATLHVYGSGEPDMTRLKRLTGKLKLGEKVVFHGFVSDQVKLSQETAKYMLGLAPYLATPGSPRWWADATKTRLYLAAGLPVITTQVPPLGKEIERDGAGIIADDTPTSQAIAITKLLKNKVLYKKMRINAIKRARNNTWENTYKNALRKMGYKI